MLRAMPKASKPGPRLALVAGTRISVQLIANSSLRAELHRPAGAAGLINAELDFQGLQAFLAREQRRAALAAGRAEIEELALEGFDRNGHWIGGAAHHLLLDGRRFAGIVEHVPRGQLVTGEDGRAEGAVQLDALAETGPESGRGRAASAA